MSIYDFVKLNIDQRAEEAWKGTYLCERVYADYLIQLYNVSNFYVEVFYKAELNKIVKIQYFKSTRLLDPYLKKHNGLD